LVYGGKPFRSAYFRAALVLLLSCCAWAAVILLIFALIRLFL